MLALASRSASFSHAVREASLMPCQTDALGRPWSAPWFTGFPFPSAGEDEGAGRESEGGGGREGTERGAVAVRLVISSNGAGAGAEVEGAAVACTGLPRTAVSRCRA